jgi:DNA-directed RNA polymerase specialized sigma24 family protein
MRDRLEPPAQPTDSFPATRWSLVLAAGGRASPEARDALGTLCQKYWYPIYAFIRRKGYRPDDAQDLTQTYFARLLEKRVIARADRRKGRFRAFLRTDCLHFLLDDARRKRVRATVRKTLSIDAGDAERRYQFEPMDAMTTDRLLDRAWAVTLLDQVLGVLAEEYKAKGKSLVYDTLKVVLSEGKRAVPAAELAAQLGTTEDAVYTAAHRLRKCYREILEQTIAATLDDPSEVEDEIQSLFEAITS